YIDGRSQPWLAAGRPTARLPLLCGEDTFFLRPPDAFAADLFLHHARLNMFTFGVENCFAIAPRKEVHGDGDGTGPPGLMAGTEPRTIVTVEILIEQDQIAPVRILLKFLCASIYRTKTVLIAKERSG